MQQQVRRFADRNPDVSRLFSFPVKSSHPRSDAKLAGLDPANAAGLRARGEHLLGSMIALDTSCLSFRGALICMPAVTVLLLSGVLTGHVRIGVIAAAGAFSVGFGSFQEIRSRRVLPMIGAAAAICVSSWIGTFSGLSPIWSTCVVTLAGALYGAISFSHPGISWLTLQALIWLVISTAYPAHGSHIPVRGSLLLAGGLLQTLLVVALWKVSGCGPVYARSSGQEPEPFQSICAAFASKSPQTWYAIRAALTLTAGMILYREFPFLNAYWIPMTVVLVLKPDPQQRVARTLQRMLGTIIGAALASWIIGFELQVSETPIALALLVLLFAGAAYALVFVNYGIFSVCLTSYVICLVTLAGLPQKSVIVHRVIATVMGAALVMASDAIAYLLRPKSGEANSAPAPRADRRAA